MGTTMNDITGIVTYQVSSINTFYGQYLNFRTSQVRELLRLASYCTQDSLFPNFQTRACVGRF